MTQAVFWALAGGAILVAVGSGLAERRRRSRVDLDRVGFMPWMTIQLAAIVGAILLASVAMHV